MTFRHVLRILVIMIAGTCFAGMQSSYAGELKLASLFADDMVLQRDKPVLVRGFADAGTAVTVSFSGQQQKATADANGQWSVTLDPMPANTKPQELKISAAKGKPLTVANILVGDVVLMARQTSIDISLARDESGRKAAASHKRNPRLRAIAIKTIPSVAPLADLAPEATTGWTEVDKDFALKMSAAAYYLGRDLAAETDVPVGIVDINLGPTFPVSWLSREALEETEKFFGKSDIPGQLSYYDERLEAEANGVPMRKQKVAPSNTVNDILFPSGGYNAVLNPLKDMALKAAVVQLGNDYPYMLYQALEDNGTQFDVAALNTTYVETYNIRKVGFREESVTVPRIVREWRKVLGDDALPFGLIVPPASDLNTLGQHHREMRELQRVVAEDNPHVGIILPGTENIRYSAQPQDEALLAKRALSWIDGAVYQKPGVVATGPLFEKVECNFNEATIYFKAGTAKGLTAKGDALDYFEAASVEGDYSPAKATIDGETIRIESDTVTRITRVRYNWNQHPNQDLINATGLPAIPFRSERADYHWFVTNSDDDLPEEYRTPANEWKKSDVTLINAQLETHGYGNFTGWIGPAGFRTGPFGPNMGVREVKEGSPADGKILVGDVIYSVNGNMLGDKAWEVMGAAVTDSETRDGKGKFMLGVRRGSENMDIELTLPVMGTYSPTAPYDCPKTEKIISNLEKWVVEKGAGPGYLNTDALFLLATGDPEMQGYVRRIVYNIMANRDPSHPIDPLKAGKSWHNSAEAILLGEYYLATGDRHVLPYLKHACDRLAATQNQEYGGWRHNFPGGATYGLIPNAGLPGVMGMHFATVAGLDIDKHAFELGVEHYSTGKAETGFLIYGYGKCERPVPTPFDPAKFYTGHLDSFNGGLSAAGILMRFVGNVRAAHLCSLISAFAWNNTFHGHGGNFWNNFWTPLGAHDHGKEAFINFWKNYRWYRECNRMFDGSLIQHESGKVGAGCGVALVTPRERIQITGAPTSPFATNAPAMIKPAVEAYWNKDYAGCETMVNELIASGTVGKDDLPTVKYLAQQAHDIQESIAVDLARIIELAEAGKKDQAKSFLAELKGIMPDGDERLAKLEKELASIKPAELVKGKEDEDDATSGDDTPAPEPREWARLVTERFTDGKKQPGPEVVSRPENPNAWNMLVVEDLSQAPDGWTTQTFDDSAWKETPLPISWRMYHTALLRTTFSIEDKNSFDLLRLYAWVFRQQGIEIYLNGELIGKINNIEKKTGDIQQEFKAVALKHLKNGDNTLAIATRHNWRWGMLSMRVYNDGFDFNLDARLKK